MTQSAKQTRFRWKVGVGIVAGGAILETLAWIACPDEFRTVLMCSLLGAISLTVVVWWGFFSGLSGSCRSLGVAAAIVTVAGLMVCFRFEGFEGDMFPRWVWRFGPTAEARAEQFWKNQLRRVEVSETALQITESDWPQFRGPRRDGIVRSPESSSFRGSTRRDWQTDPPQLIWRHPVGPAWSSFAVAGRFAYTQEQRGSDESVVCYDAATGEQLWVHANRGVRFTEPMGGVGPRATPTVSLAGSAFDLRVYALGATGILDCLDALSGELFWSRNILADAGAENLQWAMAGSPLVYDNVVVVNPGGRTGRSVAAYDRLTGECVWAAGNRSASYAAPRLEVLDGVPQLLIYGGDGLAGHDPQNGRELWFREWTNQPKVNAAQPIVHGGNLVFFSTGYSVGSMLLEVKQNDGRWQVLDRWERPNRNMKLKFNDAVYKDGYLYGMSEGVLVCLDYATGQRAWHRRRYRYGQLLLVGDVLLIQAESGEVALVEASPNKYREITRFRAIEGKTWNHPAVAGGMLYVRNAEEAACYDLRADSSAAGTD